MFPYLFVQNVINLYRNAYKAFLSEITFCCLFKYNMANWELLFFYGRLSAYGIGSSVF